MSEEHTEGKYGDIQASDYTDTDVAVTNLHRKRVERREEQDRLEHEAEVRRILMETRNALSGDSEYDPETLLEAAHWKIRAHPMLWSVLSPDYDALDDDVQIEMQKCMDIRDDGGTPGRPKHEYTVLMSIAKELKYVHSVTDTTKYAPVRFDPVDDRDPDDVTPIGRLRLPHDSPVRLEDRAVDIPVASTDHILTIAQPRRGKDSTNARVLQSLKEDHNHKVISLHDDGRNETPMWAIPSDDEGVNQSLARMNQEPKAYQTEVLCPVMGEVPGYLPANHRFFTLGLDDLTAELILRLGGITDTDSGTVRRVQQALKETLRAGGHVRDLVKRLNEYAEESEATIEVTELKDDPDNANQATSQAETIVYQMDENKALSRAASQLALLAGEGLITSPDAATNLDMEEVIRDQETVTVLNCNFLDPGDEGLKYTIMDLWLRLVYQARDANSRLPRAAIEIREIKNVCPSKRSDVKYWEEIKPLRQTIFELTMQGGSRGIMLVGSTQKLTDMYKSARSNMAIKIVLNLGAEGIQELDNKHHFSHAQREQIRDFRIGQGMVIVDGDRHYPIDFAGCRCGLGDKDREWDDRYAIAYGARVRERSAHHWRERGDESLWIDVTHRTVHDVDEDGAPDVGRWYLLPQDFEAADGTPPEEWLQEPARSGEQLDTSLVRGVLEERREYKIPSDLVPAPTGYTDRQRHLSIQNADDARVSSVRERLHEHDVPMALHPWSEVPTGSRDNYIEVLRVIRDTAPSTQREIVDRAGVSKGAVSKYVTEEDRLAECIVRPKDNEERNVYELTPIGETALETNWPRIMDE